MPASAPIFRKAAAVLAAALFLGGCAAYGGRGLIPGRSSATEVEQRMGAPALRWKEPDGTEFLAYPRGPAGFHTFMVRVGPDGRLLRIENVLEAGHFARIRPGMDQAAVLKTLGPPYAPWTIYSKSRDELAWEWRYCDDWGEAARFNVFFDGTSGRVRSTGSLTESQRFGDDSGVLGLGGFGRAWCSR